MMFFKTVLFCVLVLDCTNFILGLKSSPSDVWDSDRIYNYTIDRTWDNRTTADNASIDLSFAFKRDPEGFKSIFINVRAPFYNDPRSPAAPIDEPFTGLWDYEVVEAFFIGDNDEYLEIELAPSRHNLLLYLNGERNVTDMYLPLKDYTARVEIDSSSPTGLTWFGEAFIPAHYFPCNVSRFNAYAIHMSDPDRVYMSLFPVATGSRPGPDFHYLPAFEPSPFNSNVEISPLCSSQYQHKIDKTWNNEIPSDAPEYFLSFSVFEDESMGESVRVEINAPFYDDPRMPENATSTDEPFDGLWEYEVAEAFFLGDNDEYLEMEFAPSSHYLLLYLTGYRNDTNSYLPLSRNIAKVVNTTQMPRQLRWIGEAIVPGTYFPCNVTKFNAYAIHKSEPNRTYMSLFPVTGGELTQPDFHYLEGFQGIQMEKTNCRMNNDSTTTITTTPTTMTSTTENGSPKPVVTNWIIFLLGLLIYGCYK